MHKWSHAEKVENDIDWASNRSIAMRDSRWDNRVIHSRARLSQHAFFSKFFVCFSIPSASSYLWNVIFCPRKHRQGKIRTMDMRRKIMHSQKKVVGMCTVGGRRRWGREFLLCAPFDISLHTRCHIWIFTCTTIWILSPRQRACTTILLLYFRHLWLFVSTFSYAAFRSSTVLVRYVIFVSISERIVNAIENQKMTTIKLELKQRDRNEVKQKLKARKGDWKYNYNKNCVDDELPAGGLKWN